MLIPLLTLVLIVLVIVGFVGYKAKFITTWVKYEDPKGRFSFEYPSSWYYEPKGYTISGTWIPVTTGLYPVSKEKLESELKDLNKINRYGLTPYNWKISNFMPEFYEIVSQRHDLFSKTDVVTYKYCVKAGTLGKGNMPEKANTTCESHSLIDIGNGEVIEISTLPIESNQQNSEEVKIYKEILSTFEFTH